jgi:hypothetical protein
MAQDYRITIAIAKAKVKKGKMITKYTKAIHPNNVMTKRDFEQNPFNIKTNEKRI